MTPYGHGPALIDPANERPALATDYRVRIGSPSPADSQWSGVGGVIKIAFLLFLAVAFVTHLTGWGWPK